MQHRDRRVADAIKDSVAKIVLTELSDPNIGFVTVTRCHISRDLKNATVYFSVMGDEKTRQQSLEHLRHACGYIRRRLGQMVVLRCLPELRFALDDLLAHEIHINEIISELHGEKGTEGEREKEHLGTVKKAVSCHSERSPSRSPERSEGEESSQR